MESLNSNIKSVLNKNVLFLFEGGDFYDVLGIYMYIKVGKHWIKGTFLGVDPAF